jgi:hypothetical protein
MSKNLIIGIVAVLVLGGGALFILNKPAVVNPVPAIQDQKLSSTTPAASPTSAIQNQPKPSAAKPTATKPVAAASILSVQMSTGLTTSGTAVKPSTVFSPATPTIYAVLSLKNATQRTQLSYIRYYGGKYVDSKVSHPSKDGAKYFHFDWASVAGKTRKAGNYSLAFYVDGKKAQTVNYSIGKLLSKYRVQFVFNGH